MVGQLLVTLGDPDDHSGAAIWIDGKMRLLDSPAGCSTCTLHVNNEQQICGVSLKRSKGYDAVIWNGGQMQAILRSGGTCTCADINNSGDAVGTEHVGSFIIEAYLYHDGKIKGLPGSGCGYGDGARSINNNGQIVGWAEPAGSWGGTCSLLELWRCTGSRHPGRKNERCALHQ